jgi:hypothetical protein
MTRATLRTNDPGAWLLMAMSAVFVTLGLIFIFAPPTGAAIYGLAIPPGAGPAYLIAIGLRDLAFGLYIFTLARFASQRTLGLILGITVLIPVGDVLIVAAERGMAAWGHLLLHAGSGAVMAGFSAWLLTRADHRDGE